MSKYLIYVPLEPFQAQWLTHSFGNPVQFPDCSVENATIRRLITKRPKDQQPELKGEKDVAIYIPSSKAKNPSVFNYLTKHGKQAIAECVDDLFRMNLWKELGDMTDTKCKRMTAIYAWCENHSIDLDYAETIRMRWYRMKVAYKRSGVDLMNVKRVRKE